MLLDANNDRLMLIYDHRSSLPSGVKDVVSGQAWSCGKIQWTEDGGTGRSWIHIPAWSDRNACTNRFLSIAHIPAFGARIKLKASEGALMVI